MVDLGRGFSPLRLDRRIHKACRGTTQRPDQRRRTYRPVEGQSPLEIVPLKQRRALRQSDHGRAINDMFEPPQAPRPRQRAEQRTDTPGEPGGSHPHRPICIGTGTDNSSRVSRGPAQRDECPWTNGANLNFLVSVAPESSRFSRCCAPLPRAGPPDPTLLDQRQGGTDPPMRPPQPCFASTREALGPRPRDQGCTRREARQRGSTSPCL